MENQTLYGICDRCDGQHSMGSVTAGLYGICDGRGATPQHMLPHSVAATTGKYHRAKRQHMGGDSFAAFSTVISARYRAERARGHSMGSVTGVTAVTTKESDLFLFFVVAAVTPVTDPIECGSVRITRVATRVPPWQVELRPRGVVSMSPEHEYDDQTCAQGSILHIRRPTGLSQIP